MLPKISLLLRGVRVGNADGNTQLGPQPRHPKEGTYQGKTPNAAKKGFSLEQSPEPADSSKGKGVDDPNKPAEEIEDEDEMIGQGDRPQVPHHNSRGDANKERCPECGGDMRDGECKSCGYEDDEDDDDEEVRNVDSTDKLQAPAEAGAVHYTAAKPTLGRAVEHIASSVAHPIRTGMDTVNLAIKHPETAVKGIYRNIVHPIKSGVDHGLDKPDEYKASFADAASHAGRFGGEPMFLDQPHDQTLRAASMSMGHPASREHAMGAVDASMAGDSKAAAMLHKKSAREHLKEADEHMKDGNSDQAEAHLQCAHVHQMAAAKHKAGMVRNSNPEGINQYSNAARLAKATSEVAHATKDPQEHKNAYEAHKYAASLAKSIGKNDEAHQHNVTAFKHKAASMGLGHKGDFPSKGGDKPQTGYGGLRLNQQGEAMTLNRKEVIEFIVVNADCTPTGGPQATANALKKKTDAELLTIKSNLLGWIVQNAKAEGSFADTKGGGGKGMQAGGEGHGVADEVTYGEEEDDDLDNEEVHAKGGHEGDDSTNNRRGPMTDEEWMAAAPPRVREIVRNAEQRDNQEKLDLFRQIKLVANHQPPQKKQLIMNQLEGIKTKKGLQTLLGLILPQEPIHNEETQQLYQGAGVPQGDITDNQAGDEDLLVPPTINWNEEYQDARKGKSRQTTTISNGN